MKLKLIIAVIFLYSNCIGQQKDTFLVSHLTFDNFSRDSIWAVRINTPTQKYDTVRVIMLYCDTSFEGIETQVYRANNKIGNRYSTNYVVPLLSHWIFGYEVRREITVGEMLSYGLFTEKDGNEIWKCEHISYLTSFKDSIPESWWVVWTKDAK